MDRVGIFDAKTHLSQLVDDVQRNRRRIIIQRRGKDAAALVPCEKAKEGLSDEEVRRILEAFRAIRAKQKPLGPGESIKDFIEAGRER